MSLYEQMSLRLQCLQLKGITMLLQGGSEEHKAWASQALAAISSFEKEFSEEKLMEEFFDDGPKPKVTNFSDLPKEKR